MRKSLKWLMTVLAWLSLIKCRKAIEFHNNTDRCDVTPISGTDLIALVCRLRTINREIDVTNLGVISSANTVSLRLECSDVLFFQSALKNNSFTRLRTLEEIDIEYCKIGKIPKETFQGLTRLRNLTLKTYNTEWSAMTLQVAPDAFQDQYRLEKLDLSNNNIWTLPFKLFCNLRNLTYLNLSKNKLQNVGDLSFGHKLGVCTPRLRHLQLSYNHFSMIEAFSFAALKNLTNLNVSLNGIRDMEDQAMFGMYSLEVLDVSGNLLTTLPPELFKENKRLTKLYAQNNSITVLAPGLFTGLTMLLELNLAGNELTNTWVNSETFMDLIMLASLDLSRNKITRLDAATFRDLTNLQILKLEHNLIETISDNTFSGLFRLHTLILSHNRLKELGGKTLEGLVSLSALKLDYNEIFSIHSDALKNSSRIKFLHLSKNYVKDLPILLSKLQTLERLDLSRNHISNVNERSFSGLKLIDHLNLEGNYIEKITKNIFTELKALKSINIARNKIKTIENGAFNENLKLKAIRIDDNQVTNVHGLFSNLTDLRWLNLSKNNLEMFDYAFIPKELEYLDLRSNLLNELGNHFEIESELSLKVLDASFNRLRDVSASSVPDSIEVIYLNNNIISRIQPYAFFKKKNLTRADLFSNKVKKIDQNALRLSIIDPSKLVPEFYLGKNPFECDCTLEWLQNINSQEDLRQTPRIVDLTSVNCHLLNRRGITLVPLLEAEKSQFLCQYESHCFALCHCCDFDACDCEMTCPQKCTCFHDESWAANIVDCSSSGHVGVPNRIPMDASEVYLDGNNLASLSSHTFIGRKHLNVLYLNDSKINVIQNRTFNGLKQLKLLYLNNNIIKELKGFEFEHLSSLKELYLHENKLVSIFNTTFTNLISLEVLRLDGNLLHSLMFTQFFDASQLKSLSIAKNQWSCECTFLDEMKSWLDTVKKLVKDYNELYCVHNNTNNENQLISTHNVSCNAISKTTSYRYSLNNETLFLPIISLGASALLLTTVLIIFCYRNNLRVWAHSKYGLRLFCKSEYDGDNNKVFDAFLSYSSKDEVFVTQILAPELERGTPSYKLCLHYRDFPGGAFVTDTIMSAVESSKRTILILSENFIKSEWCRYDFKSAHHEVFRDRKKRLIVILLGDVPQKDLDPDIRLYLKTNTYLKWGDNHFWEKLKFAMPDAQPPSRAHHLRSLGQQPPPPMPQQTFQQTPTSIGNGGHSNRAMNGPV